jgi:hypothetical protein
MEILVLRKCNTQCHFVPRHRIHAFPSILLLQRSDINTDLKDFEGYRAFDVYNTTVEDTMPNKRGDSSGLELYTWGVNR